MAQEDKIARLQGIQLHMTTDKEKMLMHSMLKRGVQ